MIIGVTGGCGYIGSVLLPRLGEYADSIEIIDIKKPQPSLISRLTPPKFRYVNVDVADEMAFSKIAAKYDVIIHLAGLVGYPACAKDPELAYRCNVKTTENIMTFKRKASRVLYSSTISNYGEQHGQVDESTPLRPTSVYGETKKRAEDLVLADRRSIVFRFASAFGVAPVMRFDNLIHDFVGRAVKENSLSIYESHFIRQFVHVEDMSDAIIHAIKHWDKMEGNIYNVGNPEVELTKRELVETIARHYTFQYRFEASGSDPEKRSYPISFKKILSTGFKPTKNLEAGITELIHYFEQERKLPHAAG